MICFHFQIKSRSPHSLIHHQGNLFPLTNLNRFITVIIGHLSRSMEVIWRWERGHVSFRGKDAGSRSFLIHLRSGAEERKWSLRTVRGVEMHRTPMDIGLLAQLRTVDFPHPHQVMVLARAISSHLADRLVSKHTIETSNFHLHLPCLPAC